MKNEKYNELIRKLDLEYRAVAVKMCFEKPEVPHYDGPSCSFCQFVKYVQDTGKTFYMECADDQCYGKLAMGMIDKPPVTASGQAGYDFGCYQTAMGCRELYQKLPILEPHTINYVEFAPADECDFDPDLLFFVADLPQADILMRATSWVSGDLWESKSSPVISCSWMYAYPIISGKCNHITTGFYHGLKRRKAYPAGLRMLSVPFQKIPELFYALENMDWTLIAFREDEESKQDLARRMEHWQELARLSGSHVDLR